VSRDGPANETGHELHLAEEVLDIDGGDSEAWLA
jgi:hypothetical protein